MSKKSIAIAAVLIVLIIIVLVVVLGGKKADNPVKQAQPTAQPTAVSTQAPTAGPTVSAATAVPTQENQRTIDLNCTSWNIRLMKLDGVLYDPERLNAVIPDLWQATLTFSENEMNITQKVADQINSESHRYTQNGSELTIGGCTATWSYQDGELKIVVAPANREIEITADYMDCTVI